MKPNKWVISFTGDTRLWWLAPWHGYVRTILEENAQRYATKSAAKRARTIAVKKHPSRDLSEFLIYEV